MNTKNLTREEALKQLDLINNMIEFNNYINRETRAYMKQKGLENSFNGKHSEPTPEMIEIMKGFLNKADFLPQNIKDKYLEDTSAIFGRTWSIAQNRDLLKDRKDCEAFIKLQDNAINSQDEENPLFRLERNTETNRMNLYFDGKPKQEVINQLKHNGFKWSPKFSCWTRQLTQNAEWSLNHLKEALKDYIEPLDKEQEENNNVEDYSTKAWNLYELMVHMNNEEAYLSFTTEWPDGETKEQCAIDFATKEQFDELEAGFKRRYIEWHEDGLYNAPIEIEELAHQYDNLLGLEQISNLVDNPLKEKYTFEDMDRTQKNAEANGYKMLVFNYVTGISILEKDDIYIKNDINGNELLFTYDELQKNCQSAWHRANELSNMGYNNDKQLAKAMFFDRLLNSKDDRFSVLKEYPCVSYVLARNNNLNAPEPYVAAYKYHEDSKSWEQGHYFVSRDDAIEYINDLEKKWLNSIDNDILLDAIKSKLNEDDINILTNSIYNSNNNGKEM